MGFIVQWCFCHVKQRKWRKTKCYRNNNNSIQPVCIHSLIHYDLSCSCIMPADHRCTTTKTKCCVDKPNCYKMKLSIFIQYIYPIQYLFLFVIYFLCTAPFCHSMPRHNNWKYPDSSIFWNFYLIFFIIILSVCACVCAYVWVKRRQQRESVLIHW